MSRAWFLLLSAAFRSREAEEEHGGPADVVAQEIGEHGADGRTEEDGKAHGNRLFCK